MKIIELMKNLPFNFLNTNKEYDSDYYKKKSDEKYLLVVFVKFTAFYLIETSIFNDISKWKSLTYPA